MAAEATELLGLAAPASEAASLAALLRAYADRPRDRELIRLEIETRFTQQLAVLVLDSCGFTCRVQQRGIVHFLALFERLQALASATVAEHGGRVLRVEADNVFAVFGTVADAVRASEAIVDRVAAANGQLHPDDEFHVSIGVGYGPLLCVGDDDVFGDEMNLACKLGEDLAGREEILLTAAAHAEYMRELDPLPELSFDISGCLIEGYRLRAPVE